MPTDTSSISVPYAVTSALRLLGVAFAGKTCFQQHASDAVDPAEVRHGIMARLARSSWGLEISLLRTTRAALLTSNVRYALVTTGYGAFPRCLGKLEPQYANISARRIVGIRCSARLLTLHMFADARRIHNLYFRQCTLMLGTALRASEYSLQVRLRYDTRCTIQVESWFPPPTIL